MKQIALFISLILILSSCNVQTGSGNMKTENRQVGNFKGVQSSSSIDINIENGQTNEVIIEGDDNILPYIITEVDNGVLEIRYKSNISFRNTHVSARVIAKEINKIFVSGSGNISAPNTLKSDDKINIRVSGSGDIGAALDAPEVDAEISGSGKVTLKGRCKNVDVEIGGSGDFIGSELLAENADVSIGGSGTAAVHCSVKLKARLSGSGNIYYSGNPSQQQIDKSGSGTVEKR